jgi:hypothetical protein
MRASMKRIWLILAACLGLAAMAVPASAAMTYTLNNGGSLAATPGNYGSVTLTNFGTGANAYVRVDVELKPGSNFVGTGAGYAITWNILGNPALEVTGDSAPGAFNTATPLPNKFVLQDKGTHSYDALGGKTFSASPFHNIGEYAIKHDVSGNSGTPVTSLIFDVTETGGLTLNDFVSKNGVYFTADIFLAGCTGGSCTGNVAAVPEPRTWLLFLAGLAGLTALTVLQRRRKLVRAA